MPVAALERGSDCDELPRGTADRSRRDERDGAEREECREREHLEAAAHGDTRVGDHGERIRRLLFLEQAEPARAHEQPFAQHRELFFLGNAERPGSPDRERRIRLLEVSSSRFRDLRETAPAVGLHWQSREQLEPRARLRRAVPERGDPLRARIEERRAQRDADPVNIALERLNPVSQRRDLFRVTALRLAASLVPTVEDDEQSHDQRENEAEADRKALADAEVDKAIHHGTHGSECSTARKRCVL